MDPTPQPGESGTPVAPSNAPSTPAAPAQPVNNGQADVEAAKKETEQAKIRANQLENELKKIRDEQATADAKRLEEKEEFKTLYEQTQARLKEVEDQNTAQERTQHLESETTAIFNDFPTDVIELAKTAGLSLTDDSEAAKTSLKEKLETFKAKLGSSTVTPNNPSNPAPNNDVSASVARSNVWEGSPMSMASARGDASVALKYISELPAIKRMKEISRGA